MILLNNIYKLNTGIAKYVEDYVQKLGKEYGDNLVSVMVYGSATGNDFNLKKSDINVLLIFKKVGVSDLKKYSVMKNFSKKISPTIFTKEYIRSSQDVYPIEFLEIQERYLTVFGEDVLADLNIDRKYLRLECEQQLKGGLIKLRQGFLSSRMNQDAVERLLCDSINSFIIVFKSLLRLKEQEIPSDKQVVIEKTGELYDINRSIFISLLKHKAGIEKICKCEYEIFFERYMFELERLIAKVDSL
jgi:hypothetical protein